MGRERIAHQTTHLRIIDGGKSDFPSTQDELEISPDFVDKTMERIINEDIIILSKDGETIIEFFGPKKLPILTQIKKEEQKETRWNIRNFFRRK